MKQEASMFAVDVAKGATPSTHLVVLMTAACLLVGCSQRPAYTVTQPLAPPPAPPTVDNISEDPNAAAAQAYAERVRAAQQAAPEPTPPPRQPEIQVQWDTRVGQPEPEPAPKPVAPEPQTRPNKPASEVVADNPTNAVAPPPTTTPDSANQFPEAIPTQPADPTELPTDQLINALIEKIDQTNDDSARRLMQLAALSLLDPSFELTDEHLGNLSEAERELVIAYQMMFTELGMGLEDREAPANDVMLAAVEQLAEIVDDAKPLSIQNPTLCTHVNGFGVYTPRSSNKFVPGPDNIVIAYMEIENFKSVMNTDGKYQVKLRLKAALLSLDGITVWNETHEVPDTSRNKRRDFYLPYKFLLPHNMTLGRYILKLTITDLQGMHVDEVTLPIEYVTAEELATAPSPP
jgi:hypothetical protein